MRATRLWRGLAGATAARQVAGQLLGVGCSLSAGSVLVAVVVLLLAGAQAIWLWAAVLLQCFTLAGGLLAASGWLTLRSLSLRRVARPLAAPAGAAKARLRMAA
jgi:hypothetical protein